jgi:hypothetical protein
LSSSAERALFASPASPLLAPRAATRFLSFWLGKDCYDNTRTRRDSLLYSRTQSRTTAVPPRIGCSNTVESQYPRSCRLFSRNDGRYLAVPTCASQCMNPWQCSGWRGGTHRGKIWAGGAGRDRETEDKMPAGCGAAAQRPNTVCVFSRWYPVCGPPNRTGGSVGWDHRSIPLGASGVPVTEESGASAARRRRRRIRCPRIQPFDTPSS